MEEIKKGERKKVTHKGAGKGRRKQDKEKRGKHEVNRDKREEQLKCERREKKKRLKKARRKMREKEGEEEMKEKGKRKMEIKKMEGRR